MLIKNVKIENYRSLKSIEISNIDNLVILVGKNSSGKTNLLEALWLFFKDFSLVPETVTINSPLVPNENLWFEGITSSPITFSLEIEMNESESTKVFPSEFLKSFDGQKGKASIIVDRQIIATPPNMAWITKRLTCNGVTFIEDGKVITPEVKSEVKKSTTKIGRRPPLVEVEDVQEKVLKRYKPEEVQKIATDLQSEITGKIKYIQASRSRTSTPSNYAARTTIIDDDTNNKITQMGNSLSSEIRRRWRQLQSDFEGFSSYGQRLNVAQNQIVSDETNISVPLNLTGGGTQEIVSILRHIREDVKPIVLLEEPESHLHPELAKKLFKYVRKLSKSVQIWISTQSPFFLNRKEIDNTWTVRRENNETRILRLMDKVELKEAMLEIGIKPSDVLFADGILLVEGATEEDVIPIWARTLKVDFDELGVSTLSIRGAEKGKYCLKMWKEITRSAEIPLFIRVDSHAHNEVEECIEQGLIERDHCVVSTVASIEENYPKEYILKAIQEEWGIQMKAGDLSDTAAENIKNALIEKGMTLESSWWKPVIGRRVAKMMKINEIPAETRRLLERIKLVLT